MVKFTLHLDNKAVDEAIQEGDGTALALQEIVERVKGNANAMSADFRTKKSKTKGVPVGNKQPIFGGDVEEFGGRQVGIIYTANYAAQKHNHEHNTLLKSI